jgi:hypothetical protein
VAKRTKAAGPVLDLGPETAGSKPDKQEDVSPGELLAFAKQTLFGLAVIYAASAITAGICGTEKNEIFSTTSRVVPPIATFVLGFYFARKK